MSEARMMGSLADRLLSFVSTTPERDANYDIAVTLLKHYPQLKGMTLGQIANLCYTSKASISRFCRFLGMDSFKAFQAWLEQDFTMRTDYSRQFYTMLHNNQEMAIGSYRDTLISNIYATITPENAEVIPDIVRVLHGCGKAAYFSHHFLWDIGHYFQSKMMIMGRYVELFMDYAAQLECARSLTENDFAIICSVGGSYPTRYPDICNAIISSGCKVLVITQNLASPYLNTADFILQCGTTNRNDVGKYAALMANDLIVMGYIFDLKGYAITSANFLSLLGYVGGTNANIVVGVVASFASLIVAAVLTYLFGFSQKDLESV